MKKLLVLSIWYMVLSTGAIAQGYILEDTCQNIEYPKARYCRTDMQPEVGQDPCLVWMVVQQVGHDPYMTALETYDIDTVKSKQDGTHFYLYEIRKTKRLKTAEELEAEAKKGIKVEIVTFSDDKGLTKTRKK